MKHSKVLHVVRHAKSSWDFDGTADIDRTLKEKGIRSAYSISRKMKLSGLIPDRIYSSDANRALHTALIFARVFEYPAEEITITHKLYETSVSRILDLISTFDDSHNSVMIFGHNPDFTDLVNTFIKSPIDNIPTSGAVTLKFNTNKWFEVDKINLEKFILNFPAKDE